jgi:GH3 auxin-responsive promoter
MDLRASAANLLWAGASAAAWRRYRASVREPLRTQQQLLAGYLNENCDTVIGRSYNFRQILTSVRQSGRRSQSSWRTLLETYQDRVPLTTYDELEPLIKRVAAGDSSVLTRAGVRRLVPSSGSTSAAKLIPYTRELQAEFSRAIDAWVTDLYLSSPRLARGQAYWSISPAIQPEIPRRDSSGASSIPVGFDDDSEYLRGVRRALVRAVLAVPDEVRWVTGPETFRYVTLLFLVRARNLRLISVWHPSFLSRLLEALPQHLDRLIADVARGTMTPPGPIDSDVRSKLARMMRPDPDRAANLRRLSNTGARDVWPALGCVSCWGDASARPHAMRLARDLDGVTIQAKGLIATEAIVTIPFGGFHPVAVRSHFFEFLDPSGRAKLVHELERDVEYTPVVTTAGGLYRYRMGDLVRVDGWVGGTPSLRFVGRSDRVSDRFGEKLSDGFTTGVIARLFEGRPVPRFAMLAPEPSPGGIAYTLLVEPEGPMPPGLATALERELRRNPHYAWCVDLGQLQPARVACVPPGADQAYVEVCAARGQRLGDVKPVSLQRESGWEAALCGAPYRAPSPEPRAPSV